tara:strand:- start:53 stop:379 length:327 start_codon:yes stop_codon:yes gene_type:complete
MKHKTYLFFRTSASASVMVPASEIYGFDTESDTLFSFYSFDQSADAGTQVDIPLTIDSGGRHEEIFTTITEAINKSTGGMIVIADDISGEYIHPNITAVGTFGGLLAS